MVIDDEEKLARFVLFSKWIRSSDGTVKPDAFIPHPYPDLSVTRHIGLSDDALWRIGQAVVNKRPVTLYGRADIKARIPRRQKLSVDAAPEDGNANHANIRGWPADKPKQKSIAQQLAAAATYISKPGRQP